MISVYFAPDGNISAGENGELLGYLNFSYANDASEGRNIEVSWMFVFPAHRKKGIGTKMLQFLFENSPNATWVSGWTGKEIEMAEGTDFHVKNGFKKLAYLEDYYEKGIGTTLVAKRLH